MIERLQAQLRYSASQNYTAIAVPPFTCFINPDDPSPWSNYAIPDRPIELTMVDAVQAPLATLCALYQEQGRRPRFELIAEYAPGLAAALATYGFTEESQNLLMLCTPASWQAPSPLPGLQLRHLSAADLGLVQEAMTVQRRSFGESTAFPATQEEAVAFLSRFTATQIYLAQWGDQGVSAAMLQPPSDGLTEIAGIATLREYRRRGIGAALTAYAVQQAFAQGLEGVFLTAADAAAGRVYARVGFQTVGMGLAYSLPDA